MWRGHYFECYAKGHGLAWLCAQFLAGHLETGGPAVVVLSRGFVRGLPSQILAEPLFKTISKQPVKGLNMPKGKRFTQQQAIDELVITHGHLYNYSLVIYTATKDKIKIICKDHGVFEQRYNSHKRGSGCPDCPFIRRTYDTTTKSVYRRGYMPVKYNSHYTDGKITKEYNLWSGMMTRCYNPKYHQNKPTYVGVEVCDSWLHMDNFADWCQHQIGYKSEGFQLDKDILVKGNKLYCPELCVFVPTEINSQLTKANSRRGDYPIGVSWHKGHEKFMACLRVDKKTKHLGYFTDVTKAFEAYKVAKENYLKVLADKYRDVIDPRCYDALYNYKVEITD